MSEEFDASNAVHVKERTKRVKEREAYDRIVVRQLMGSVEGRAWIFRLLSFCHIYANPYSRDTHDMAFACGEMNVGQIILADVQRYCPGRYLEMVNEANGE